MQELTLNSWEEYEDALVELERCRERLTKDEIVRSGVSPYYYRGQSDSAWKLETTLERFTNKRMSLDEYYEITYSAKPRIETFSGMSWELPKPENFRNISKIHNMHWHLFNPSFFEYFAYLRHHGYPSPLLDWSASPYIAAFFAFRNVSPSVDNVSVYVYQNTTTGIKVIEGSPATIVTFWPQGSIHQRHFLQQSDYTLCIKHEEDKIILTSHETARISEYSTQDMIWKFNLPTSERKKAIQALKKMNINAYSLFLSIDSLMETIGQQQIQIGFARGAHLEQELVAIQISVRGDRGPEVAIPQRVGGQSKRQVRVGRQRIAHREPAGIAARFQYLRFATSLRPRSASPPGSRCCRESRSWQFGSKGSPDRPLLRCCRHRQARECRSTGRRQQLGTRAGQSPKCTRALLAGA